MLSSTPVCMYWTYGTCLLPLYSHTTEFTFDVVILTVTIKLRCKMKSVTATQKRQEEPSLFSDSIVGESQSTWPSACRSARSELAHESACQIRTAQEGHQIFSLL